MRGRRRHLGRQNPALPFLAVAVLGVVTAQPTSASAQQIHLDTAEDTHALLSSMVPARPPCGLSETATGADLLWMGLDVVAPSPPGTWFVAVVKPHDRAVFYLQQGTACRPLSLDSSGPSALIPLPLVGGRQRLILGVESAGAPPPVFHLATRVGFARVVQTHFLVQGIYLGIAFLIALLHFALYALGRERELLLYAVFVTTQAVYFAMTGGIVSTVFPDVPRGPWVQTEAALLLFMALTGAEFARAFLDSRKLVPAWDAVLRGFSALTAALFVINLFAPQGHYAIAQVSGHLLPAVLLLSGAFAWRAGSYWAPRFVLAWTFFGAGVLEYSVELLPTFSTGVELFQLGSAIELAILTEALVHRFRLQQSRQRHAEQRAERAHRLATLGELAAGVAHEVGNPNNLISFNLPMLRDVLAALRPTIEKATHAEPNPRSYGMTPVQLLAEAEATVDKIEHGSERIDTIVRDMKDYVRERGQAQPTTGRLHEVVAQAIRTLRPRLEVALDAFEVDLKPVPSVRMVASRIEQVVLNLIDNAVEATQRAPRRIVRVSTDSDREEVRVTVEDSGPGVSAAVRERIFEPFFTTKNGTDRGDEYRTDDGTDSRAGGLGLGLALASRIATEHEGTIDVRGGAGQSRFVLRLPRKEP